MIFSCLYWKYNTDILRNIDSITLLLTKIYMLLVLFSFLYYGKALNKNIVLLFGFAVIQ